MVSKSMQRQLQGLHGGKTIHDIVQDDALHAAEQDKQERSFDAVRVKYINLDSIKSILFTKLELLQAKDKSTYGRKLM